MSLLKIWQTRNQIMEGIKNSIIRNIFVEQVSQQRMSICNECPELDKVGGHCFAKGTQPCCKLCGCSLGFKTRALSSECPVKKWESVVSVDDEEHLDSLK